MIQEETTLQQRPTQEETTTPSALQILENEELTNHRTNVSKCSSLQHIKIFRRNKIYVNQEILISKIL